MSNKFKPKIMGKNDNGIRVKIYISGHMIGAGKMELFKLIHQYNSVSKAAKCMGMSFSRAIMLLNSIEDAFNKPLLNKRKGNKGTELTEFGITLLLKYEKLCDHLTSESKEFINWTLSNQGNN